MYKKYLKDKLISKNLIKISDIEEFTLKSGKKSNIYVNLKDLVIYPDLLSSLTLQLSENIKTNFSNYFNNNTGNNTENLVLCGVPYGAIPLSTNISMNLNIPQIMVRKDRKTYGTKKQIEGLDTIISNINNNDKKINVILIEDVVSTGSSVLETIEILLNYNCNILGVYSIVYRGDKLFNPFRILCESNKIKNKIIFDYLFHLSDLLDESKLLCNSNINNKDTEIVENLKLNDYWCNINNNIKEKGTNIILAYDKSYYPNLLNLLEEIHPYIIGLKIHHEILYEYDNYKYELSNFCRSNNIFLWEDRKFNDIGKTLVNQITSYTINSNCPISNCVSIVPTSGKIPFNELPNNLNYFILCEMSSKDNLFTSNLKNNILLQNVLNDEKIVVNKALICQSNELINWCNKNEIVTIKPGINLLNKKDNLNQQYTNPREINECDKATMYVIGRGITDSNNPIESVKEYIKYLMSNSK